MWAVPGTPGAVSYAMGPVNGVTEQGATLTLPVVGPSDVKKMFGKHTRSNVYSK